MSWMPLVRITAATLICVCGLSAEEAMRHVSASRQIWTGYLGKMGRPYSSQEQKLVQARWNWLPTLESIPDLTGLSDAEVQDLHEDWKRVLRVMTDPGTRLGSATSPSRGSARQKARARAGQGLFANPTGAVS